MRAPTAFPNLFTAAAFVLALLRACAVGPKAGGKTLLWAALRAPAVALPLLLMVLYRR